MKQEFWKVIKDNRSRTYEVLGGLATDDRDLDNLVFEMQKAGMDVNGATPAYPATTKESMPGNYALIGFKEEKGLMTRLKREHARRIQKDKGGSV